MLKGIVMIIMSHQHMSFGTFTIFKFYVVQSNNTYKSYNYVRTTNLKKIAKELKDIINSAARY